MSLKNFAALVFQSFYLLLGTVCAEELNIYFKTSPSLEMIRPFADPVNLSLLVTGAAGKPVEHGTVDIRLDAPKPGRFFSTDIPVVEGTRLMELRMPLRQGRANWKYLFPIRGNYRLLVETTAPDGRKASATFEFKIRENEMKWGMLAAFCAGLFFFGFIAGRIFTPSRAEMATALIAVALAGTVLAHDGSPAVQPQQKDPTAITIEPAVVGKPARVHWRLLAGEQSGGERVALFSLAITHLEKGKIVFAVEKVAVDGEYGFDFHFPDGAEYRINAVAEFAGRPPVRDQQLVTVSGVEPPLTAQIPALGFFLAVIAVGLGAGRFSKPRVSQR